MDFNQRMATLSKLQRYIKSEIKEPMFRILPRKVDYSELLELASAMAEELPDYDIEYDELSYDSKREFFQDLAYDIVDRAERELEKQEEVV